MRVALVFFGVILAMSNMGFSQTRNATFDGKISIADDGSAPTAGTIRFNSSSKIFEGYDGAKWINLSLECVCPYVLKPFNDVGHYEDFTLTPKVRITLEFSHKMDPSTFVYGTNVLLTGSLSDSASGTLTWFNGNTKLIIESSENWSALTACFSGFDLQILGTGANAVKGANGNALDGDRDGCCGGDYDIHLSILC